MGVKILPFDPALYDAALEVIKNSRKQTYTPETLCQVQKIIETKYYYWWIMDMKKEEYALDLFTEDFTYYNFGPQKVTAEEQARRSKYVNEALCTMHMGHQPLIWLISDTEAKGIFQYEDNQTYKDDGSQVEGWAIYVDDFVKGADGVWRIKTLRMGYKKMDGAYKNTAIPEDWKPQSWEVE